MINCNLYHTRGRIEAIMENTGWVMPTHIIAGAGIVINENDEVLLVKTHNAG